MKLIEVQTNNESLTIFPIGDLHFGSQHFNRKIFEKLLKDISNTKNARILLMGDLAETATRDSVGAGVYEQQETAQQQMMYLKSVLYPYKDIIDAVVTGNHEERIYKQSGFDITQYFCEIMNIPEKYLRYQGVVKYHVEGRVFLISMWHGSGGGGSAGASLNKLQKQSETVFCDVYLMGHVHKKQVHTKDFFIPSNRYNFIERVNQYFIVTGSSLDYENSYAEMAGFSPSSNGFLKIKLSVCINYDFKDAKKKRDKVINVEL